MDNHWQITSGRILTISMARKHYDAEDGLCGDALACKEEEQWDEHRSHAHEDLLPPTTFIYTIHGPHGLPPLLLLVLSHSPLSTRANAEAGIVVAAWSSQRQHFLQSLFGHRRQRIASRPYRPHTCQRLLFRLPMPAHRRTRGTRLSPAER